MPTTWETRAPVLAFKSFNRLRTSLVYPTLPRVVEYDADSMAQKKRPASADPSKVHKTMPVPAGLDRRSGSLDYAELRKGCDAIVEADLFDDLALLETQNGGAGEAHLPAGRRRQRADQLVLECRTGMRAAPPTDQRHLRLQPTIPESKSI